MDAGRDAADAGSLCFHLIGTVGTRADEEEKRQKQEKDRKNRSPIRGA